jgi:hypothetical protein
MRLRFRGLGFRNLGSGRFAGSFRRIGSVRHAGNMGRVRPARKGAFSRMCGRRDHGDVDERAAAFRRQSRQRQSPPRVGIGSRAVSSAHQQFPDRSQPNSVPHPEQTSRRWVCCPIWWVMNKEALPAGSRGSTIILPESLAVKVKSWIFYSARSRAVRRIVRGVFDRRHSAARR